MVITKNGRFYVLALAMMLMAGCGSTSTDTGPDVETQETQTADKIPTTQFSVRNGKLLVDGDELDGVLYFDFDQSIVKRAGHAELNTHAQALSEMSDFRVRVEGHADERGTREYNNALGERRANAIRAYLMSQGGSSRQMEVISYGEEKPVAGGHDEDAWAQNRRVELIYR